MKTLFFRSLLVLVCLSACNSAVGEGPVDIKYDRDTCHKCGMVISDRQYAAEVRGGPKRAVTRFDDVGCALSWLEGQTFFEDPTTFIWVADMNTGTWLDARAARFVGGRTTPMGYGFGAAAANTKGVDFEAMRQQVKAADGHHTRGTP